MSWTAAPAAAGAGRPLMIFVKHLDILRRGGRDELRQNNKPRAHNSGMLNDDARKEYTIPGVIAQRIWLSWAMSRCPELDSQETPKAKP